MNLQGMKKAELIAHIVKLINENAKLYETIGKMNAKFATMVSDIAEKGEGVVFVTQIRDLENEKAELEAKVSYIGDELKVKEKENEDLTEQVSCMEMFDIREMDREDIVKYMILGDNGYEGGNISIGEVDSFVLGK